MADQEVKPGQPPAAPVTDLTTVMAAFSKAEKALEDAVKVSENLVHDEASSLRGLFTTVLATLRSGKPGGA